MVSLAWRSGIQASQVMKQLLGISCHCPAGFGENKVLSCADAVAKAIQAHMQASGIDMGIEQAAFDRGACPECGGVVEHEGGCAVCRVCGYSECAYFKTGINQDLLQSGSFFYDAVSLFPKIFSLATKSFSVLRITR